jgi:hypothetical protein
MNARRLILSIVATGLAALGWMAAPAFAAERHLFSAGFGSFAAPIGVAVNQSTGHVYVADENGKVDNFEASGAPDGVKPQLTGATLAVPYGIAVDNSSQSSKGDIYVADVGAQVVDQFDPSGAATAVKISETSIPTADKGNGTLSPTGVAVDSNGNVFVADDSNNVVDEFSSLGVFVAQLGSGVISGPQLIAIDNSDNLYVANGSGAIELDSAGACVNACAPIDAAATTGVAVDGAGNVYASEGSQIAKYDSSHTLVERFGAPTSFPAFGGLAAAYGMAVENSTNAVYVADPGAAAGDIFKLLTVPDVTSDQPSGIQSTSVVLEGSVNPDGTSVSNCQFEWGTAAGSYPNTLACTQPALPATGSTPVAASAELTGLEPGHAYHYRLSATNENATSYGQDEAFTTRAVAPVIGETFTTGVSASSAKLNIQIDPGGAETTFHFQYGTTTAYGQSTPESPEVGADNSLHSVATPLQELQPDTTYHYRVVATNEIETVDGPDRTFTTQRAPEESFALPDGRAYELVSPPQKDGAEVLGIGGGAETPGTGDATQASEDGTSVTYITDAPVSANGPGNTFSAQVVSTRAAGGWSSRNISPPHIHPTNVWLDEGEQFRRFSPDLSRAVLIPLYKALEPPLAPELHQEVGRGQEIYLRNNVTEAFQALDTSEPLPPPVTTSTPHVIFEGGSPDLSHVVFHGPAGLDPKYATGELYEWFDGRAHLVSVLPNGEPTNGLLGGELEEIHPGSGQIEEGASVVEWHAVSNDGTRVFWTSGEKTYMRDIATEETIPIPGEFQTASSDGSRVFTTEGGNIYMFDVGARKLTNLTPNPGGGQLQEVVGADEQDTSIYVLARAVLTEAGNGEGEIATAGANNLYLLREAPGGGSWSTTFIADGLEEGSHNGDNGGAKAPLGPKTMRVSPNGRYLAFMSRQSLTGYDNHDANSGQPDMEVYLYDAEADRLACASCNPTGARPVGQYDTGEFPSLPMDPWTIWVGDWLSAAIPGWTPDGAEASTGYQPRFLSDTGQLFFDSADGLVPQDVNGKEDVYEYEVAGAGSCRAPGYGQSASLVFSEEAGGCVGLISAGTGSSESAFFDASANGNNVFFTTEDGLVSEDRDGVSDMYDARVCTTAEPCLAAAALPPACTTADSCRTAPLLQPGVFGAPPSATFEGTGNLSPPVTANGPKHKTAAQIRAEKLAKALKACRSKPRSKRRSCQARARKRYGKAKPSGRRIK